jgi:hypothetical protein
MNQIDCIFLSNYWVCVYSFKSRGKGGGDSFRSLHVGNCVQKNPILRARLCFHWLLVRRSWSCRVYGMDRHHLTTQCFIKSPRSPQKEKRERNRRCKGHICGLFEPQQTRNETWRPLWGAKKDLDRKKEIPQDRSESMDGLRIRELFCREVAR